MKNNSQDWEKEFDEKFPLVIAYQKDNLKIVDFDYHSGTHGEIKDFIRANFVSKDELQEKIVAMKRVLWNDDINQHSRNIERENVLNDVLELLK